jgi:RimJ/RimL family protein N-acetyltransferase
MEKNTENEVEDLDTYIYTGRTFRARETRESDIPSWYKWFNDPEVFQYLDHRMVPNTEEIQKAFRLSHINGNSRIIFSLIDLNSTELIGTCSTNVYGHWRHGHAELSMVIGNKKYQRGPMCLEILNWQLSHAFLEMNMHSVLGAANVNNHAIIGAMERLGYTKIGIIRENYYLNGKYHDAVHYDILKDEWLARNHPKEI